MASTTRNTLETATFLARDCTTSSLSAENCSRILFMMSVFQGSISREDSIEDTETNDIACPLVGTLPQAVVKSEVLLQGCHHNMASEVGLITETLVSLQPIKQTPLELVA